MVSRMTYYTTSTTTTSLLVLLLLLVVRNQSIALLLALVLSEAGEITADNTLFDVSAVKVILASSSLDK